MTSEAMIRPLDFRDYESIPEHTQGALRRYVENGLEPGGFLTAVLCNDLMGAIGRADWRNAAALKEIAQFVYNEIPGNCWGSYVKMVAYMDAVQAKSLTTGE
jgi:hypothetical protein